MNWFLFQDYVRDFLRYWRTQNFTSLDAYFLVYKDKANTTDLRYLKDEKLLDMNIYDLCC